MPVRKRFRLRFHALIAIILLIFADKTARFRQENGLMRALFEKIVPGQGHSFAIHEFRQRIFTSPFHFHPECELTVIMAGCGRRFVGDSVEDYGPGDLVLVGANLPHRWASTLPNQGGALSRSLVLQFRRDCLGATFFEAPELAPTRRLLEQAERGLCFSGRSTDRVTQVLGALHTAKGGERIARFVTLLDGLTQERPRLLASPGYRADIDAIGIGRIDRVISHVEACYADEELALTDAAHVAGMSPSAFSRFFARVAGRTFVSFVTAVRLSHACRLLAETDRPVTEICFACGFGTISNFNTRFRAMKGCAPGHYRRSFRLSTHTG